MIIHNTLATNTTLHVQQLYIDRGCLVRYTPGEQLDFTYKGAYTETVALPNKVYKNVLCLDYVGLYPNCVIARNIDPLTFSTNIQVNSIDVSDDDAATQSNYYYTNDIAVTPVFMKSML